MYQIYGYNCVKFFNGMWVLLFLIKKKYTFYHEIELEKTIIFFKKKKKELYFGSQTSFIRKLANDYNVINDKKIISFFRVWL